MNARPQPATRDELLLKESNQLAAYEALIEATATGGEPLPSISVLREGDPPRRYTITYRCRSLRWDDEQGEPVYTGEHVVQIDLGTAYPVYPATVQTLTPAFHPNIGDGYHGGYVCLREAPNMSRRVIDIVHYVGELLRFAILWPHAGTRRVFDRLRSMNITLPTDPYSFPAPDLALARSGARVPGEVGEAAGASEVAVEVHMAVKNGGMGVLVRIPDLEMTYGEFLDVSLPQIVQSCRLPLQHPNGEHIAYTLKPAEETPPSSMPALTLVASGLQEVALLVPMQPDEAIERFRQANPTLFNYKKYEGTGRYWLSFAVELFAPSVGAYQEKAIVRTRANEALLEISPLYPQGQLRLGWITPIHHPYLLAQHALVWPPNQAEPCDLARFLNMLASLLNYEPQSGLEVVDTNAEAWVGNNAGRIQWLRSNTSRLKPITI